eukprot:TRINITY_DN57289_c0_g1_i1.p2 TRINITY_DN57289_c0_g1~~TRINITY_DN57289_c0_g1_i1.p2  ORF type:complete len:101 (+),score=17.47 TRINITY_DN57289_c0_g1_i1:324-626(+)
MNDAFQDGCCGKAPKTTPKCFGDRGDGISERSEGKGVATVVVASDLLLRARHSMIVSPNCSIATMTAVEPAAAPTSIAGARTSSAMAKSKHLNLRQMASF